MLIVTEMEFMVAPAGTFETLSVCVAPTALASGTFTEIVPEFVVAGDVPPPVEIAIVLPAHILGFAGATIGFGVGLTVNAEFKLLFVASPSPVVFVVNAKL